MFRTIDEETLEPTHVKLVNHLRKSVALYIWKMVVIASKLTNIKLFYWHISICFISEELWFKRNVSYDKRKVAIILTLCSEMKIRYMINHNHSQINKFGDGIQILNFIRQLGVRSKLLRFPLNAFCYNTNE